MSLPKHCCGYEMLEKTHRSPFGPLVRTGWKCVVCGHFDKAIGRERIVRD